MSSYRDDTVCVRRWCSSCLVTEGRLYSSAPRPGRARYHKGVEPGPGVAQEGQEPVGEGGDEELEGEEGGEEGVEAAEELGEALVAGKGLAVLRLDDGARKALCARAGSSSKQAGEKQTGDTHAQNDESDDTLTNAVAVDFPHFPLTFSEKCLCSRPPSCILCEFIQERQDLVVQLLRASSKSVCTTRVIAFGVCSNLKAKKVLRLATVAMQVTVTVVRTIHDCGFKVCLDKINAI